MLKVTSANGASVAVRGHAGVDRIGKTGYTEAQAEQNTDSASSRPHHIRHDPVLLLPVMKNRIQTFTFLTSTDNIGTCQIFEAVLLDVLAFKVLKKP